MSKALTDRYRCPAQYALRSVSVPSSTAKGYFRFGPEAIGWGRHASFTKSASADDHLPDLIDEVKVHRCRLTLPFDATDVVDNLRYERYLGNSQANLTAAPSPFLSKLYYSIRPIITASTRAALQRAYLHNWDKISFPRWPLDTSVDHLLEALLALIIKASGLERIPFVWFWPDGASAAAIVTHDVETAAGLEFCSSLMDIDESFGIRSSYQLVPEERYTLGPALLDEIRRRGHEINIQDLNHDGCLFRDRRKFLARVKLINEYGCRLGARGFRAALLHRNLGWYNELDFAYDMSVPCVGHLEAQRGGCCTVFPYFVGDVLDSQ